MPAANVWILRALIPLFTVAAAQADVWSEAARNIVRLQPSSFAQLPAEVVRELSARGCTVPQTYMGPPHNVISGSFAAPEQMDWALLCSENGVSSIHVLWGGPKQCPAELLPRADADWLQDIGEGKIGYSRSIAPIAQNGIRAYASREGVTLPAIEHDGIEQAFLEKASTVHYCHDGKWIEIPGAD